jgi:hypothetical protein
MEEVQIGIEVDPFRKTDALYLSADNESLFSSGRELGGVGCY